MDGPPHLLRSTIDYRQLLLMQLQEKNSSSEIPGSFSFTYMCIEPWQVLWIDNIQVDVNFWCGSWRIWSKDEWSLSWTKQDLCWWVHTYQSGPDLDAPWVRIEMQTGLRLGQAAQTCECSRAGMGRTWLAGQVWAFVLFFIFSKTSGGKFWFQIQRACIWSFLMVLNWF